jgi:hypothetical protein
MTAMQGPLGRRRSTKSPGFRPGFHAIEASQSVNRYIGHYMGAEESWAGALFIFDFFAFALVFFFLVIDFLAVFFLLIAGLLIDDLLMLLPEPVVVPLSDAAGGLAVVPS